MKNVSIVFFLLLLTAVTAYSGPSKGNSANATRERAKDAYGELNQGKKQPATTVKSRETAKQNNNQATPQDSFTKPVIMVLPAANEKGLSSLQTISDKPFAKAIMDGLNDYLSQKHYDVKSLEGNSELEKIIQMQNDIAGNDEDLAYLASLSLNADIYIKFSGTLDAKGFVTVDLSAYESSTARLLGSQSSSINSHGRTSKVDQQSNLKSAAKKAMPSIETQILSNWKEELNKGTQYKVIMNITGSEPDSELEDKQDRITQSLKAVFNKVKVNSMTAKTIDLVVYADPTKFEDVNEVYRTIRQTLKPFAESKKLNITKKLIVMEVK